MLPIALVIGRICGAVAEARGGNKRFWFWLGTVVSFSIIYGLHQVHEFKKIKSMGLSPGDIIRARFAGGKQDIPVPAQESP